MLAELVPIESSVAQLAMRSCSNHVAFARIFTIAMAWASLLKSEWTVSRMRIIRAVLVSRPEELKNLREVCNDWIAIKVAN